MLDVDPSHPHELLLVAALVLTWANGWSRSRIAVPRGDLSGLSEVGSHHLAFTPVNAAGPRLGHVNGAIWAAQVGGV